METSAFLDYLEREKQDILANCTRCGKCVEVCPMPQYSEVQTRSPEAVIREVADLLETGVPTPAAGAWASSCSNSGHCIPACPEGVNPRKMLALARLELRRHEAKGEVATLRQAGRAKFEGLHDAIRLLLSMQLRPEAIGRLLPGSVQQRQRPADVVFYFGCNILKTPDIALPGHRSECAGCARPFGGELRSGRRHGELLWHQFYAGWRCGDVVCASVADPAKYAGL